MASSQGRRRFSVQAQGSASRSFEPAAFCLTMTSLYFTAMANGNSKMYYSEDLTRLIEKAGMKVDRIIDGIGQGHNILICVKE